MVKEDIRFYKDCDEILVFMVNQSTTLSVSEVETIVGDNRDKVIQDLLDLKIVSINEKNMCLTLNKEIAIPYYNRGYYKRLLSEAVAGLKRDELSERSTISAEKSSQAAVESAKSAKKANIISIIAILLSVVAIAVKILKLFL